ncbi:DUF2207 domain-containing protein [Amycolatopsis cihanbeyliensis]|uniref:Putative membrane protein DUF2207 n=1 Tax=Amycolatopsis cihanbeyliensis TaxID=1128664 RepID=A0A542DP96_AMYCI|nr:DUF2207 domain-containing protein [Amycolatopsis cihanbeyliensis]TQJ04931.1 putative membrane protein DUF2207 [Amycolatopsis cihanbeyliensis]
MSSAIPLACALLAAGPLLGTAPAPPPDAPPLPTLPRSVEVELKVHRDGSLAVTEAVSVPAGERMRRQVSLRLPHGDARQRVLGVRDVRIEGSGSAELTEERLGIDLGGGTSIVRYTVDGAVTGGEFPRVHWRPASGWDTDLELVRGSFAAPRIPEALDCAAGAPGAPRPCLAAQVDHAGLTRFSQRRVPAGERIELAVDLPPRTVPPNARIEPAPTLAGAFLLTPPVAWAWALFGVFLLVLAVSLGVLRRADAAARTGPVPGSAPPAELRPGQAGVLVEGRADAVDLAVTLLDLRERAPEDLRGFERLAGSAGPELPEFGSAVRADLVRHRYLHGSRPVRAGWRIVGYGVFLTVVLALTTGHAQLGLVLAAAGAALACWGLLLPPRTRRGRAAVRALRGIDPERAPLPWAVALGRPGESVEVAQLIGRLARSAGRRGRALPPAS